MHLNDVEFQIRNLSVAGNNKRAGKNIIGLNNYSGFLSDGHFPDFILLLLQ